MLKILGRTNTKKYLQFHIYSSINSLSRIPAATANEMLLERDSLIEGHRVNAIPDACTHSRTRPTRAIHKRSFRPTFSRRLSQ